MCPRCRPHHPPSARIHSLREFRTFNSSPRFRTPKPQNPRSQTLTPTPTQPKPISSHPPPQTLSIPPLATTAPNHSPLPLTLQLTTPSPPSPFPTQFPTAAKTALPSSLGTRIQTSICSTLRMSSGIAVPVSPRNCWSAEVRCLCAVISSRGQDWGKGRDERRVRWM